MENMKTHMHLTVLSLVAKRCPYPDPPENGEVYYEDTVYQNTINYTCYEG